MKTGDCCKAIFQRKKNNLPRLSVKAGMLLREEFLRFSGFLFWEGRQVSPVSSLLSFLFEAKEHRNDCISKNICICI